MPRPDAASRPRLLAPLLALGLGAGWVALLQTPLLQSQGVGVAPLWQLQSLQGLRAALPRAAAGFVLEALLFAPLGLLACFVFRDRASRIVRLLAVGLPAMGLGLGAAFVALWLRDRTAGVPGASDLLLPALGVWLGVLVGMALRRGLFGLVWLPVRLAVGTLLLVLVVGALAVYSFEREPAVAQPAPIQSDEKREIVALLHGKDPRQIAAGDTRTLRFDERQIGRIVAWGLPLVVNPERVRALVRLGPGDAAAVDASIRVPFVGRWLDATASGRAWVSEGRFELADARLRLGRCDVPRVLLRAATPLVVAAVRSERRLRGVLPEVHDLRVDGTAISATYGRIRPPRGFVAGIVWGEAAGAALKEPVAEQVRGLLVAMARAPKGDARFAKAYETAFARARERSAAGGAVEENRAAILALAIVLGSTKLGQVVGDVLDEPARQRVIELRRDTTVRRRSDWTRHFSISSALTVLSSIDPSNAAGLLKEELDADGGSGFSFGDLLADRAGTTFGQRATRDETAAAALQARLAAGFVVDDVFPPAADLPEGIPDAELRARYGGVGGPLFRQQAAEIERRVAACAAYK